MTVPKLAGGAPQAIRAVQAAAVAVPQLDDAIVRLVEFARLLRAHGVAVSPTETADFVRAGMTNRIDALYWCGRITLVTRHPDIAVYDQLFVQHFGAPDPKESDGDSYSSGELEGTGQAGDDPDAQEGLASAREQLEHRDFALTSEQEFQAIVAELQSAAFALPLRRVLRRRPRRTGRIDVRRTVRRELRGTSREHWHVLRTAPKSKPRRLVLVLDVSRSMSAYSRYLVIFAHAMLRVGLRVEVYCFSTRLSRLNEALAHRDVNTALAAVSALTPDRDSGTRIGSALENLLADPAGRGALHGGVVAIVSDGLEQGEIGVLSAAMTRVARLADSVIWVNPLKGSEGYLPLQQGMMAALPHIDEFIEGHDLSSLRALAAVLSESCR